MSRNGIRVATLAVCAVGILDCGSNSGNGNSNASSGSGGSKTSGGGYGGSTSSSSSSGASTATIRLSKTKLGRILTDGKGRTLYLFEKDKGTSSTCFSACAKAWPPLMTSGKPKLGGGLAASKVGTTSRKGGGMQVTYGGHPLYYFYKDTAAHQTKGQGIDAFGAEWYVLSASGKKVEAGEGEHGS